MMLIKDAVLTPSANSKRGQSHKRRRKVGGRSKKQPSNNYQLILYAAIGGLLLIIAIVGVVVYLVVSGSSTSEACSLAADQSNEITLNSCGLGCEFDVSSCAYSCPFGYQTNEEGCAESCVCATKGLFEGDIKFSEEEVPRLLEKYGVVDENSELSILAGSVLKESGLWGDDIVDGLYYVYYDETVSPELQQLEAFKNAIKNYDERTCIRVRPRGNRKGSPCVQFLSENRGCWSAVGKSFSEFLYKRCQKINIQPGACTSLVTIQHEIMHTLGFFHEQSRNDRDDFVNIVENNMNRDYIHNFKKLKDHEVQDLESPYDFVSIMHYPPWAFSTNNKPTIVAKQGQTIRRHPHISDEDTKELNILYPCPSKGGKTIDGSVTVENKGDERFNPKPPPAPTPNWNFWGYWADCNCKEGNDYPVRRRIRTCLEGTGMCGPIKDGSQEEECRTQPKCPDQSSHWMFWGGWGPCNTGCRQRGYSLRQRVCHYGTGFGCQGQSTQTKSCEGICTTVRTTTTRRPITTTTTTRRPLPTTTTTRYFTTTPPTTRRTTTTTTRRFTTTRFTTTRRTTTTTLPVFTTKYTPPTLPPTTPTERTVATTFWTTTSNTPATVVTHSGKSSFNTKALDNMQPVCTELAGRSYVNLAFGDFNGDHKADVFCAMFKDLYVGYANEGGQITTLGWEGRGPPCAMKVGNVAGDFNGDGFDDIVCRNGGGVAVILSQRGEFSSGPVWSSSFCLPNQFDDQLLALDIDGNGKDDLLCRSNSTGKYEIRMNQT